MKNFINYKGYIEIAEKRQDQDNTAYLMMHQALDA